MLLKLQLPPTVPKDVPLLVAYSGGADSRLLLFLAKNYGDTHHVPIYAAHLHHGIRGEEADRDLRFCRRTTQELGIRLFEKQVDIPALCQASGKSPEQEAREQRYLFFSELMSANRLPVLLTAHHADDQLETLLHRFLRGSGTRGMGGIPEVRPLAHGIVVRPLLGLTKADILAACHDLDLDYVTDSTNEQPFTLRNRLRTEIIPKLEHMVGEGIPQRAAERLSRSAREDEDFLSSMAAQELTLCRKDMGLSLADLHTRHPALVKRMLSLHYNQAVMSAYGSPPDQRHTLTSAHLDALLAFSLKAENGTSLALPLLTAHIHKGTLTYPPPGAQASSDASPMLLTEGDTLWDQGRLLIRVEVTDTVLPPLEAPDVIASALFPCHIFPLWARPRREGDIILSHGMHKKLKKILCDKGVPPYLREQFPLICQGDDISPLWYPTAVFADGFPPPTEGPACRISLILVKKFQKEGTYE